VKNILAPGAQQCPEKRKIIKLVFAVDDEFVTIWRLFSQEYDAR